MSDSFREREMNYLARCLMDYVPLLLYLHIETAVKYLKPHGSGHFGRRVFTARRL